MSEWELEKGSPDLQCKIFCIMKLDWKKSLDNYDTWGRSSSTNLQKTRSCNFNHQSAPSLPNFHWSWFRSRSLLKSHKRDKKKGGTMSSTIDSLLPSNSLFYLVVVLFWTLPSPFSILFCNFVCLLLIPSVPPPALPLKFKGSSPFFADPEMILFKESKGDWFLKT